MYSDRYWEMFNEIDGNFDDVAIRTFKVNLPAEHDLRKSLTRKHGFETRTEPTGHNMVTENRLSFWFFKLPKLKALNFQQTFRTAVKPPGFQNRTWV